MSLAWYSLPIFRPLTCPHSFFQSEAGCRMTINMVLLRLAPLVRNTESKLTIVPEYPIAKTKMEEGQSLGDIVDYLLARHPAEHSGYCLSSLHMNRADGFLLFRSCSGTSCPYIWSTYNGGIWNIRHF